MDTCGCTWCSQVPQLTWKSVGSTIPLKQANRHPFATLLANAKHGNIRNTVEKLDKSIASCDQKQSGKWVAFACFKGIVDPTDCQVSWGT